MTVMFYVLLTLHQKKFRLFNSKIKLRKFSNHRLYRPIENKETMLLNFYIFTDLMLKSNYSTIVMS